MYADTTTNQVDPDVQFKQELRGMLIEEAIKLKKAIGNLNDPNHLNPVQATSEAFQSCLKMFEIFANRLDLL
jgi:hypothetical protein